LLSLLDIGYLDALRISGKHFCMHGSWGAVRQDAVNWVILDNYITD